MGGVVWSPFGGGLGEDVDEVGERCGGVCFLEVFLCGEAGADEACVGAGGCGCGDDFGVVVFVGGVAVVPVAAAVGGGGWEVAWCGAEACDEVFDGCFEVWVVCEAAGFVDDEGCFGFGFGEFVAVLVDVLEDVDGVVGGVGCVFDVVECLEAFEAAGDDGLGVDGGDGGGESCGAGFGVGVVALEAVGESAAVGEAAEDGVGCADVVEDLECGFHGGGAVDVAAWVEEEWCLCGGCGFHVGFEVWVFEFLGGDVGLLDESGESGFGSADEEVAAVGPGLFFGWWCGHGWSCGGFLVLR